MEWGWPTEAAGATGSRATAQERLAEALGRARAGDPLTGRLVEPLRDLIHFGWGDAAFYLDPEGWSRARRAVWGSILARLPDGPTDLTMVGHSLGAVLAHDFLLHLCSGRREGRRPAYAPEDLWERAEDACRVRRPVNMGSPLGPLMVRSPELVDRMAAQPPPWLDPADIGLGRPCHSGRRPVWLNVWDRHDLLAFPVAGLYRHQG